MVPATMPQKSRFRPGVFLVGFMGSGKTSVGELLSQRLGWRFQDLDARIESRLGCSIPQIFSNRGEARFRQIERQALIELIAEMASTPTVAALGGGAFAQADNRSILQQYGWPAVFLDAPVEDLWQRCRSAEDRRPLARDENLFRQLYAARRGFYMEAALRIDTSAKNAEAVAAEIALWLQAVAKEK